MRDVNWHTAKSAFENLGRAPGETQESLLLLLRKRVFLGLAVGVFSLVLFSDSFLVAAGTSNGPSPAAISQQMVAGVSTAYVRTVRFVNGLRTLYQVAHLDELTLTVAQPAAKSPAQKVGPRVIRCKAPSTSFPATSGSADTKSAI